MRKMLDDLDRSLGDTFDPESKSSVLGKFDELLSAGTTAIKRDVYDMVDPGKPESPLGRLKNEISAEFKELHDTVELLRTQVVGAQASARIMELTAIKGRKFEEIVFEPLASFVALYDDAADLVGDSIGSGGNCKGDIVVTLNDSSAVRGHVGAGYVVEVKDKRLSLREALRELELAMENRSAHAGVSSSPVRTSRPLPLRWNCSGIRRSSS